MGAEYNSIRTAVFVVDHPDVQICRQICVSHFGIVVKVTGIETRAVSYSLTLGKEPAGLAWASHSFSGLGRKKSHF